MGIFYLGVAKAERRRPGNYAHESFPLSATIFRHGLCPQLILGSAPLWENKRGRDGGEDRRQRRAILSI